MVAMLSLSARAELKAALSAIEEKTNVPKRVARKADEGAVANAGGDLSGDGVGDNPTLAPAHVAVETPSRVNGLRVTRMRLGAPDASGRRSPEHDPGGDHHIAADLVTLMGSPDIASRRWIWEQYDHMVGADTVQRPGGDAAVVRVHGTDKALAITTDCTPRYCYADPYEGGKQCVAEAWRNLTAVGSRPIAITDNLNFGNPEKPHIAFQLTEAVRRRPYTLVLFDEVEKAHPDVFDVLLQVLDEGRLTDGQGRTVDFRNTVIILTSNLGAGGTREETMDAVKKAFKPEFINRLDDVVMFEPLSEELLRGIVDIQLRGLAERLDARRLTLQVSDSAKSWLAERGYDPAYGARPLRRTIQQAIGDKLAKKLLAGDIVDGDTVHVDVADGGAELDIAAR